MQGALIRLLLIIVYYSHLNSPHQTAPLTHRAAELCRAGLCRAVLCCAVPCRAVLCRAVLGWAGLRRAALRCPMLGWAAPCCAALCSSCSRSRRSTSSPSSTRSSGGSSRCSRGGTRKSWPRSVPAVGRLGYWCSCRWVPLVLLPRLHLHRELVFMQRG